MKRYYQHGFTLVEVLLYLAISSIMLIAVSMFVQAMFEARIKHQTVSEVEQQGQRAMNLIGQTLRKATAVCTPTAGSTATSLSVNTGAGCGANQPTIFSLSGATPNVLRIQEGASAAVDLTNDSVTVTSLSAKNLKVTSGVPAADQRDSVQVIFTISYYVPGGSTRQEYSYTKTFQVAGSLP